MKISAKQFPSFKNSFDYRKGKILIHGPDEELIEDYATDIIECIKNKAKNNDNILNIKRYTADEITESPELLLNQMDLFASNDDFDLFLINNIKDKHLKSISQFLDSDQNNRNYILTAPGVTTKSKIVKLFAESKTDSVIGVYDANIPSLVNEIIKHLTQYNIDISTQDASMLAVCLNGNRRLIKNSVEKISLYYQHRNTVSNEKKKITFHDCKKVITTQSLENLDNLINLSLLGNIKKIPLSYENTVRSGNDYILILRSFGYRINRLLQICNIMTIDNISFEEAIKKISPPVFFKEKDTLLSQIKYWNKDKLAKAINIIYKSELHIKTGGKNVHNTISRNILNITQLARKT